MEPNVGDTALCSMCDATLVYIGPYWRHVGEIQPKHPALPRPELSSITDDQVRTAIAVLTAYVAGTLETDLCDELDAAIEAAWTELLAHQGPDYDEPSESPLTQDW